MKTWKDVWYSGPGPRTLKNGGILYSKGLIMGAADLIPGVSGGTVAFITGIYHDLLAAVSSINKEVFKDLITLRWKDALSKVHLRFLFPLAFGILSSIFGLARVMHFLMNDHPIPTWGLFFGLIAASIVVIGKELPSFFSVKNLGWVSVGAVFAWVIVSLIPVTTPDAFWFIFLCGIIGITAMILPGLSGSFLLLILGKYEFITGAVKNPFDIDNIMILLIFFCGTVTGLLGFSKFLNFCLKKYHDTTMGILTGILIGSMKKVWPWKEVIETKLIRGKLRILRDANILPGEMNTASLLALGLMVVGFIAVLLLDHQSRKGKTVAH